MLTYPRFVACKHTTTKHNSHAIHDCIHRVTAWFIFARAASSARETPQKSKSRLPRPFQLATLRLRISVEVFREMHISKGKIIEIVKLSDMVVVINATFES